MGKVAVASIKSILQAGVLASAGLYLGRTGIMTKEGAKLLSSMSMKITIPCLLFSRVLPSVDIPLLTAAWPMLLLPLVTVSVGALLGYLTVLATRPPDDFRSGMIAAVAFGNSTGMPIVLLTVIDSQLHYLWEGRDAHDHRHHQSSDPVVYLSIYLITYPIIQWVVGGWLLQPLEPASSILPPPIVGVQAGLEPIIISSTHDHAFTNRHNWGNRCGAIGSNDKHKSLSRCTYVCVDICITLHNGGFCFIHVHTNDVCIYLYGYDIYI